MLQELSWFEGQLLAYHHAAHAVMQLELGREPIEVRLVDPRHETGNICTKAARQLQSYPKDRRSARLQVAFDCLYLAAGWAMESVVRHTEQKIVFGYSEKDFEDATHILGTLYLSKEAFYESADYVRRQAIQIIRNPGYFGGCDASPTRS